MLQDITMMSLQEVIVAMRLNDYRSKSPVDNGNESSSFGQPSNSFPPLPSDPL